MKEHFGHGGILKEMFDGLALDEHTVYPNFELQRVLRFEPQRVSARNGQAANH
jgi:hypothetical protein